MASTEEKVLKLISKKKEVNIVSIAKEIEISTDYARLICRALQRRGRINFLKDWAEIKLKEKTYLRRQVKKPIKVASKNSRKRILAKGPFHSRPIRLRDSEASRFLPDHSKSVSKRRKIKKGILAWFKKCRRKGSKIFKKGRLSVY